MATTLEGLKDEMIECNCCGELLLASTNKEISDYTYYCKKNKYYYFQPNCRRCQNEITGTKDEQAKKRIREKRALERANRKWSIYKMTINTDRIVDRIKEKYTVWHNNIYYIGVTKQEPHRRWQEHLYGMRTNTHGNKLMQDKYNKIRGLYKDLDDKEFQALFESDIIKFEVITILDKDMTEYEAHLHEEFEIKALENNLKRDVKEAYLQAVKDNKSIKKLIYTQNDAILNLEHCKSSTNYLKEIDKKNTLSGNDTRAFK